MKVSFVTATKEILRILSKHLYINLCTKMADFRLFPWVRGKDYGVDHAMKQLYNYSKINQNLTAWKQFKSTTTGFYSACHHYILQSVWRFTRIVILIGVKRMQSMGTMCLYKIYGTGVVEYHTEAMLYVSFF